MATADTRTGTPFMGKMPVIVDKNTLKQYFLLTSELSKFEDIRITF
jgi:hypothetical protein